MDELLEYDEPPQQALTSPPPAPQPVTVAQQHPQFSIANGSDDDDDDDHITLQELYDAAQILVENNKEITTENMLTIITATRHVKTEFQSALLLRRMQQVLQQRQERELRERRAAQQAQAAGELLLLNWLLNYCG